MVTTDHYRAADDPRSDRIIEGRGYHYPAGGVGIKDTRLGSNHQAVSSRLADPVNIVRHLLTDIFGRLFHEALKGGSSHGVTLLQIGRVTGTANPAERAEAVVEADGSHDILDIRRVTEPSPAVAYVGAGT